MKKTGDNSLDSMPTASLERGSHKLAGETGENAQDLTKQRSGMPSSEHSEQVMESNVSLLDDGPCHIHVYWHINPQQLERLRAVEGLKEDQHTMVLRLYDTLCTAMTGRVPCPRFELEVTELDGYRYLEIPESGKSLVAELVLRESDDRLFPLAASGPIPLPGTHQTEIRDQAELVVIDEPGVAPRVVGLFSTPSEKADRNQACFSGQELRAINAHISDQIPARQNIGTMVSMVDIDPHHIHVYWHVNAANLAALSGAAGWPGTRQKLVLRLHDALCTTMSGFIPWPPMESELTELSGNRRVQIPDAGKTLVAELALRGPRDTLVSLIRSKPVQLPQPGQATTQGPVNLVLVEEPGAGPRVVATFTTPTDKTLRGSLSSVAEASPHPHGVPSSFTTRQWYWKGDRKSGTSSGEHD